jgi:hypothetical protein
MPKSRSRKRGESQLRAAEKGKAVPSYAREVTKELVSKPDKKVARNR